MKSPALIATLLFFTNQAFAVGNFDPVEISSVYIREGRTDIYLVTPHSNPKNCPDPTALTILADEFPNSKLMVGSVLGAHLAGKKITGWIGGCHDSIGKLFAVSVEK